LEKYKRFTRENARQLQCKALRKLEKSRRRKNNGKTTEKTMRRAIGTVEHPDAFMRSGACGGNANAKARPPLPAPGAQNSLIGACACRATPDRVRGGLSPDHALAQIGDQDFSLRRFRAQKQAREKSAPVIPARRRNGWRAVARGSDRSGFFLRLPQ